MTTSLRRLARSRKAEYKETSDSEESDPSSDYEEPRKTNKRARPAGKGQKRAPPLQSGPVTAKRVNRANLDQLEAELPENHLFRALAQPEIDTVDLALEWIDAYIEDNAEDKNDSLTSLINLVLRSCGSVHLFEPHDLVNLESAAETVGELTIAFGSQNAHKYPFKALPAFKKNVLGFFENVITISHEKGLLYKYDNSADDDYLSSPLMTHILTWISSLSSCTIRPLRYISTLILLTIQNQLCHTITHVVSTLDKSQRQLSKTAKKNKKKYENILATVQSYQNQKNTILEYFSEICNITLGHRYRDVDPTIRQECLRLLGVSMVIYPDHFFQASFLRYYGWLLSDPTSSVRLESTKVLLKLYKNASSGANPNNISIGFRQFTERYKEQLIKMNKLDSDFSVRLNTISISSELLKIGFLSESDNNEVMSIFFEMVENETKFISKSNLQKTKQEIGKFIGILNNTNTKAQLEKYAIFIDRYESEQFGEGKLQIKDCLRVKDLIRLLKNATAYRDQDNRNNNLISQVFNVVYQLPSYDNSWEFLVKYFLLDTYSITFTANDETLANNNVEVQQFKELLDLSKEDDRAYFLNFIDGAVTSLLRKKQELSGELIKLVNYLPSIQSILIKSNQLLRIFLNLWYQLILVEDDTTNIFSVFKELGQMEAYNEITIRLLKCYQCLDGTTQEYENIFSKLVSNYESTTASEFNILTPEVRIEVQNLVEELVAEAKDILGTSDSLDRDDLSVQKKIIGDVIELAKPLEKLYKLGDYIDLNSFLKGTEFLDLMLIKIFAKFNMLVVVEKWASNFLLQSEKLTQGFKTGLDMFLIISSWKIEKLIYVENESIQAEHDITALFQEVDRLLKYMVQIYGVLTKLIRYVLENELTSRYSVIKQISELRTLFAAKFIDFVTSIKIFYLRVKDKNQFGNFDQFFNNEESAGFRYIAKGIPAALELELVNLFLYKEAQLASTLGKELERTDEEDVNIEELIAGEEPDCHPSMFDSDGEQEEEKEEEEEEEDTRRRVVEQHQRDLKQAQAKQKKTWGFEKELCVYTLKLFGLADLNMASSGLVDRIRLNEGKLGGVFSRVVKQHQGAQTTHQSEDEPIEMV